jgi:glycosyltransferase involved in cell wall biosynthesis
MRNSISIITICFNSGKTIERTIQSVLTQGIDGLQYIIIDGGSTDDTLQIVQQYRSSIGEFVSEPDRGISDAFNKGITLANGDIVGIINADDVLMPGALRRVQQLFAEHDDVDVIHGDVILFERAAPVKRIKPSRHWWYPWRLVLFNHPATFARKRVYQRFGLFDESYRIAMDVEMFLRWSRGGIRMHYIKESFVSMRGGGLSSRLAYQGFWEKRLALLSHGYSPFLTHMQYYGNCAIQAGLRLRDRLQLK